MKSALRFAFGLACLSSLGFGSEIFNREGRVIRPGRISAAAARAPEDIIIGRQVRFRSEILNEERTLEIHLPDNYLDSQEKYPVLIALDGGWFFRYCVSIADVLSPNHYPRMIVVGLPNVDRRRDLDPIHPRITPHETGTSNFQRFLKMELFPYLEKEYRMQSFRILAGHSAAGMFTLYNLLSRPELFDAYIATSPSIGRKAALDFCFGKLEEIDPRALGGKFLFVTGGGEEPESLRLGIREWNRRLAAKKIPGLIHAFEIYEGEGHVPVKGFYQGIRNLFDGWMPKTEFFFSGTLDEAKRHYAGLTERYGFEVRPPTAILNSVGRRHIRNKEEEAAAALYEFYVSVYPESPSGHYALAVAYEMGGKIDAAVKSLETCLRLDPENEQAKDMLQELRGKQSSRGAKRRVVITRDVDPW